MSTKKNIVSNFLLTSSQFIFPLITFPFITRTLSNESLGSVIYVDAFTQYFIIFSSLGIPLYGVREISKLKNNVPARSKLVAELLTIKVALASFFVLLFFVFHFFIPQLKTDLDLVKLGCISIISSSLLMEWFYQGIENYTYITKRSLIVKTLSIAFILLLVKTSGDSLIYYAILVAVNLLNAVINFSYYLKKHHHSFVGNIELKKHFKPLITLFLINVAVSVYTILDTIILGTLTDLKQVSYYDVTLKLSKIVWTIVLGIGFVLVPRISILFKEKKIDELRKLMSKSFNLVFLITIPFCFFCLIFSKDILILVSGAKYLEAENSLKLFSILPFVIGVCNIMGTQFLLPIGQEKKILHATVLGLVVSLSLNFSLIPYFGFMGASVACVFAEISVCTYIYLATKKEIKILIDFKLIKQILLSLTITAVFIYFFKSELKNIYCILISFGIYSFSFIGLHFLYFKNTFINSILNSISLKSNE